MKPDLDDLYAILCEWASKREPKSYSELSRAYQERTGYWFEPHGTWDRRLGDLNRGLAEVQAPPISALVIRQDTNEPGGKFWGCAPNVPPRPSDAGERAAEWTRILKEVCDYPWPEKLPF